MATHVAVAIYTKGSRLAAYCAPATTKGYKLRSKAGRASHRRTQKAKRVNRDDPASQNHQRYGGQKPVAGHGDAEDHDRQCARSDQRQDRAGLAYSRVPAGCHVASRELRGVCFIKSSLCSRFWAHLKIRGRGHFLLLKEELAPDRRNIPYSIASGTIKRF
jgi:hypothetical protein